MRDPPSVAPVTRQALPARSEIASLFYGQLAGLLKAGMPLPRALRTLATDAGSTRFRAALTRVAAEIDQGVSAADAFRKEEDELGGMLAQVTAAAAATGNLAVLLAELSAWSRAQERILRRITDALAYPYLVLLLASLLSVTMMVVVSQTNFFDDFSGDAWLLSHRSVFVDALAWSFNGSLLGLMLAIPLLGFLSRISPPMRTWRERLYLRLPGLGAACRALALARFCGAASVLLKARVPYHQVVTAAGELTGFAPYVEATRAAAWKLEAGVPGDEVWSDRRLFPESLRFILASAQARGDLPEAFEELAALYEQEADGRARILALLAPSFCFLAVGIGFSLFLMHMLGPLIHAVEALG